MTAPIAIIMGSRSDWDTMKPAAKMLEEFGVSHVRRIRGDALSGGERRRVEIARSLASKSRFIRSNPDDLSKVPSCI